MDGSSNSTGGAGNGTDTGGGGGGSSKSRRLYEEVVEDDGGESKGRKRKRVVYEDNDSADDDDSDVDDSRDDSRNGSVEDVVYSEREPRTRRRKVYVSDRDRPRDRVSSRHRSSFRRRPARRLYDDYDDSRGSSGDSDSGSGDSRDYDYYRYRRGGGRRRYLERDSREKREEDRLYNGGLPAMNHLGGAIDWPLGNSR